MSYRPDTTRPKPCPHMKADQTCDACKGSRHCISPREFEMVEVAAPVASLIPTEQHPDDKAVDAFAAAMKAKMAKQRAKGYGGWEDKAQCTDEYLADCLMRHAQKGDPVDVANFAMMLHQRHGGDTYIVGDVLKIAALDFARRVAAAWLPEVATPTPAVIANQLGFNEALELAAEAVKDRAAPSDEIFVDTAVDAIMELKK